MHIAVDFDGIKMSTVEGAFLAYNIIMLTDVAHDSPVHLKIIVKF